MGKILGIDIGTKMLGVALSDDTGKIAFPKDVVPIENIDEIAGKIEKIADESSVETIVIGLPVHLSGDESKMSSLARKVANELDNHGYKTKLWDERLSSIEAERTMRTLGKKPSRNKNDLNKIAAAIILQSYLDSINTIDNEELY